jgi:two-component system, chemotaxis family, protein-glutamate methylesterase/glutaminase
MEKKTRVLIVDDSETIRIFLNKIFIKSGQIEIVDSVGDAHKAAPIIVKKKPDVVTLDITMPGLDGLTFLEKLMKNYPTPVVMFSSYTSDGSFATETALKLGAVGYMPKPQNSSYEEYEKISDILVSKVIDASKKEVQKLPGNVSYSSVKRKISADIQRERNRLIVKFAEKLESTNKVVLIGSSTGGTDAIGKILDKLPPRIPPIVIVQHMPENYTKAWAGRLNTIYDFDVKEAEDGETVEKNKVYIAPGGKHIVLKYTPKKIWISTTDTPPLHSCKPSVDVLFNSIKDEEIGKRIIGVILTGMGQDGAEGMLNIKKLGGYTLAQDKESCLIYGMPKAAMDNGSIIEEIDLKDIPYKILENL